MCGKCEDCEHYKQEKHWTIVNSPRAYICELTLYDGGETTRDTLAVAGDAEGYFAALYVQPNFGCVQFKAKTA